VTAKDAIEYTIAYNLRTCVEAYKESGSRDDAWDDAAIEFLTAAARHFASAKGCKSRMELVAMAEPLVEMGCDDPLMQYCHGALLYDAKQDKASQARGLRFVERSYTGLVERGYPANRCFAAANRIWKNVKKKKDQAEKAEKYLALTKEHALETLLQDNLENNDGRNIYDHLNGFAISLPLESRREFCEDAKEHEEKSPYVVNMLVGEYHLVAAWKSRGGDFAPEVSEEGWKGFGEHMELARKGFEKAWEAAPNRPEAATAMVKVSMGSSRSPLREMRMWYDRAVQAQFDYPTAYSHLIYSLMPRWHGSHDLMYKFGVECMETERYDTNVPYELCNALWSIMRDNHNPLGNDYVQKPGIYDNVRTVCQRYIEQEGGETNVLWWKTVWLCFAYLAEQWDDASQMLEELDSDLNANALGRFPLAADEVISAVQIHTSPHADAILEAFRDADHGRQQQAATAMTEILTEENLQPFVVSQIQSRLQGLNWSIEFEEGLPVNLVPEENLQGWKIAAGRWNQSPDGGMRGVSNRAGVMLECETDFGTHWQISGEVVHGKSPYNHWDAGILLIGDGRPQYSMMFNPTEKWVAAGPHKNLKQHRQPFKPEGKTTKFVIRVEGDIVNIWLNEDLVVEDQEIEGLSDDASSRLAIGAKYTWDGSTLTYRNLEIVQVETDN